MGKPSNLVILIELLVKSTCHVPVYEYVFLSNILPARAFKLILP